MTTDRDKLAQAWGFKDADEIMSLHEQAFPGYADARQQADEQMAELEQRLLRQVDEINQKLPDGVKYVIEDARSSEGQSD